MRGWLKLASRGTFPSRSLPAPAPVPARLDLGAMADLDAPMDASSSEAAPTSAGTDAVHLRVVHHLSKPCVCMLCSAKSTDASPLLTHGCAELEEGGEAAVKLPWKCHRKVTDRVTSEQVRVPEGRVCLICFNVFRVLGLDAKYGAPKAYVKKVLTEKQGNHGNFLASRSRWVEEHNDNPSKVRLRDKDALQQAATTLETTSSQGAKLTAPKRQFVLVDHWDEASYGPLSEQTIVERTVFGVVKKGVYRLTGKVGHYEVEDYDTQALTERTVEHVDDGESALQAEGLLTKKEALQATFREAAAEQEKHAAAVSAPSNLEDVLAMLHGVGAPGAGSNAAGATGAEAAAKAEEPEAVVESSDEEVATDRFSKALGKAPKPKAKAKTAAKPKPTPKAASKANAQKGGSSQGGAGSGESGQPGGEPFALDGRGNRLREGLVAFLTEKSKLAVDLAVYKQIPEGEASGELKAREKERTKHWNHLIQGVAQKLKSAQGSSNAAALEKQVTELEELKGFAEAGLKLHTQLAKASPHWESVDESLQVMRYDLELPETHFDVSAWAKILKAHANHHLTFRNYVDYVGLFRASSPEAGHRETLCRQVFRSAFLVRPRIRGPTCNTCAASSHMQGPPRFVHVPMNRLNPMNP